MPAARATARAPILHHVYKLMATISQARTNSNKNIWLVTWPRAWHQQASDHKQANLKLLATRSRVWHQLANITDVQTARNEQHASLASWDAGANLLHTLNEQHASSASCDAGANLLHVHLNGINGGGAIGS